VQDLHITELAFLQGAEDMMTGTLPAVPDDAPITIETTANGVSGAGKYFYDLWRRSVAGESGFFPLFIGWYMHDEYEKECPKDFKLPKEIQYISEYVKDRNKQYWYYCKWQSL